ncbi:MAG: sugar transferase [Proteobacteria bacterium]|nr:sugar transferase [Pseudomonadota bacterium]
MKYQHAKRLIDVLASAVALAVLSPLLLVLALAIRLESPGSPLFFQQRTGRGCKPFYIVKFRSMVKDASKLGSWQTAEGDPRITRLGRFIRATSLDELPQLWNVLMGDMSLIGPRPNTPQQISQYPVGTWEKRHVLRPGITGLSQVNGRSNLSIEQQIAYDLRYNEECSLMLDVHILLKTVTQVLRRAGVN